MIDWDLITQSLPEFWGGLQVCLLLLAISVGTGFVVSVPLAMARVSARRWLAWPVWTYTYVFRDTPLLVQLFII